MDQLFAVGQEQELHVFEFVRQVDLLVLHLSGLDVVQANLQINFEPKMKKIKRFSDKCY